MTVTVRIKYKAYDRTYCEYRRIHHRKVKDGVITKAPTQPSNDGSINNNEQ